MVKVREVLVSKLMQENSKANMRRVQEWIGRDSERVAALFGLLKDKDPRHKQRAAWVIGELDGELIKGYWNELLSAAENPNATDAIRRNIFRLLQTNLPEEGLLGKAWDLAFLMAGKRDEPIAVRAFAFSSLENICRVFPELKAEMVALALQEKPYTQKGLLNRIDKVLQRNRDL